MPSSNPADANLSADPPDPNVSAKARKRKEGWLGVILTAVLCLGFLYWWFRPEPEARELETASQLVVRAMAEPRSASRVEQQVIDFDLMEIAICQAGVSMLDEARATLERMSDPVIQTRAVRHAAQAFFGTNPQDFGLAVPLADLLDDPRQREEVRTEILGQLAVLGFVEVGLKEAKTTRQKADLARRIADTPEGHEKARQLLVDAGDELPSLSAEDAAAVREHIAEARIKYTRTDGADAAIAAIRAVAPDRQLPLWKELAEWGNGIDLDLRTVLPHIDDPRLRRKLEIDSLLFIQKPWPAAEIIGKFKSEADAATAPEAKVTSMISLGEATRNAGEPDTEAAAAAANKILRDARTVAGTISDPAVRCRALLELTHRFNLALLFDDSRTALDEATKIARTVQPLGARVPLLAAAADEHFQQANPAEAHALVSEAADQAETAPTDAATLQAIAMALVRRGDWPRGLGLVDRIADNAARLSALEAAAEAAAFDSISINASDLPPRGEPVDTIRNQSAGDQFRAARLAESQPSGYARTRAWLAMAKGLIAPPANLTDSMAARSQTADPPEENDSGPGDAVANDQPSAKPGDE
jgi:hypothetical protein